MRPWSASMRPTALSILVVLVTSRVAREQPSAASSAMSRVSGAVATTWYPRPASCLHRLNPIPPWLQPVTRTTCCCRPWELMAATRLPVVS
jgi:hypothetical protein